MEFREVVKLLHQECNEHFKNKCVDCRLSKNYLCQDIIKMKGLSLEKIEQVEKICRSIENNKECEKYDRKL